MPPGPKITILPPLAEEHNFQGPVKNGNERTIIEKKVKFKIATAEH